MSLTKPITAHLPNGLIPDRLTPESIFHDEEIPVLYTTRTFQGQENLAYVADINAEGTFTIVVPLMPQTLKGLQAGTITILEALFASPAAIHWTDGNDARAWALDLSEIPDLHLPKRGLTLHLEQEPIFRTRAIGEQIQLGHIPASAIAFVADSTRKALKTVLDYVFAAKTEGRPRDEHRTMYDLPVQSFAFASFELSFAPPDEGIFSREDVRLAAEKLESGLAWASGKDPTNTLTENSEEREVILRAALLLTPPSSGPISEVQVSGAWLKDTDIVLTRGSRRKVLEALREVDTERHAVLVGRLGELDSDRLTFILRDTPEGEERRGAFGEELLADMVALLTKVVVLVGTERKGKFAASAVADIQTVRTMLAQQEADATGEEHS